MSVRVTGKVDHQRGHEEARGNRTAEYSQFVHCAKHPLEGMNEGWNLHSNDDVTLLARGCSHWGKKNLQLEARKERWSKAYLVRSSQTYAMAELRHSYGALERTCCRLRWIKAGGWA